MSADPDDLSHLSLWTRQRAVFTADRARWGLRRAVHMALMRMLHKTIGFNVAVVHSRPLGKSEESHAVAPGYEVRELTDEDYRRLPDNSRLSTTAEFIDAERANGSFCMGAFKDDELVAHVWRAFGDAPADDGLRLRLAPHLRYGYKALTLTEHRGLHLQSPISLISDQTCIDRGCTLGASFVASHNYPSRAGDIRRGATKVGWLIWLCKGPVRWCYTTRGARRFGVELYVPEDDT